MARMTIVTTMKKPIIPNPSNSRESRPEKKKTISGKANARNVATARRMIQLGCSRRCRGSDGSDIVVRVGEGRDAVADDVGDGEVEGGDFVGAGGGVEDDGGETEALLERAAPGIDVLDTGHRHAGAGDRQHPTLKIDFEIADLVAPVPPADRGDVDDAGDAE